MIHKDLVYGWELVLDLWGCDPEQFRQANIQIYYEELCKLIDMERMEVYYWDDFRNLSLSARSSENPKTWGISSVQFIKTSSITIHALPLLKSIFVNLFSCKEFDPEVAETFTEGFFGGESTALFFSRKYRLDAV